MVKLLQNIDLLGDSFELRYGKSKKQQTVCGGIVTILTTIWITATFYFFISQLFDSTELELSNSEQFSEAPGKIDLYQNLALPIVGADNGIFQVKQIIPKIFTFKLTFFDIDFDENKDIKIKKKEFNYVDCAILKERGLDLLDRFLESAGKTTIEFINDFAYCPNIEKDDLNELYVQGNIIFSPFRYMVLTALPCTLPADQCAPSETLSSAEVVVTLPQISFDPENKDNPLFTLPTIEYKMTVNPAITIVNKIFFQENEIYDDKLDFFSEKLKDSYASIDRIVEDSIQRGNEETNCDLSDTEKKCFPYARMIFESTGKKLVQKRNYVKVFNTLGEMGGMRGVIIMLIGLGYGIFCGCFKGSDIVEREYYGGKKNFNEYRNRYTKIKKEKKVCCRMCRCCCCKVEEEDALTMLKEENEDGVELMKTSEFIKFMKIISMKDHHLKLVTPLMIMNIDRFSQKSNMGYRQAYQNLMAYEPKNEVERKIKDYIANNLPNWLTSDGMVQFNNSNAFVPVDNMK